MACIARSSRRSALNSARRSRTEPTPISTIDWNRIIAASRDGYDACVASEVSPQPVDFVGGTMSFAISFVFAPCTASMSPPIAAVCVNSVGLPQRLRFFRLLERSLETTSWLY